MSSTQIRKVVPTRFAEDELAAIDTAAARRGQSRSEFIRQEALRASMLKPRANGRPRGECRHGLADCRICQIGRYAK